MSHRTTESTDVLAIGEALVDVVVTPSLLDEHPGGSPANVALGLARLGRRVDLLTSLGVDERGRAVASHLEASGVRVLSQSFTRSPTSTATATIANDGHAEYLFDITWELAHTSLPTAPKIIHTGSIAAFLEPGATAVRKYMSEASGSERTFDPNIRPALLPSRQEARVAFEHAVGLSTVVKLSDEDMSWLYPGAAADDVLERMLALGPNLVALTLGQRGSVLRTPRTAVTVEPVIVNVVDTIGAGDTYMASLIDALLERPSDSLSETELLRIGISAARAAALTVSRVGADLPYRRELPPRE